MQISPQLSWRSLLLTLAIVPLAVGVIPFSGAQFTLNAFVSFKTIVLALGVAVTLLLWALSRPRGSRVLLGREMWALAIFLLLAAVSAALSPIPRMAVFGDLEQGTGMLVVSLCAATFFLVTQLARSEARLTELTSAVVITAAVIAGVGLLQQLLLIDVLGFFPGSAAEWMARRGYGTIGNPDTYAAYLVLPAFLALRRLTRASTSRDRLVWGLVSAVILSSFALAQTRGPLVGLALAGGLYLLDAALKRRRGAPRKARAAEGTTHRPVILVALAAIVLLGIAALVWGPGTQFAGRFGDLGEISSLGGRVPMWRSAIEIAAEHPWFGIGPDSFRLAWYHTRTIEHLARGAGLIITDPHNVYLHVAATLGIPALLAFLAFVAYLLYRGFVAGPRSRLADYDGWLFGLVALLISLLTSMFATVLLFMLFTGLAVVMAPLLKGDERPNRRGAPVSIFISSALALALTWFAVMTLAGHVTAMGTRVDDAFLASERAERAVSLAPWDNNLRDLRNETSVNAALEAVFTGTQDVDVRIDEADRLLVSELEREPQEYRHYYRSTLLLIGIGQLLPEYTTRGIDIGFEALSLYPNSLELRTGLASGYLQRGEPGRAEAVLAPVWSADPNYLPSGSAYVQALMEQGKADKSREALALLNERFPGDADLVELNTQLEAE